MNRQTQFPFCLKAVHKLQFSSISWLIGACSGKGLATSSKTCVSLPSAHPYFLPMSSLATDCPSIKMPPAVFILDGRFRDCDIVCAASVKMNYCLPQSLWTKTWALLTWSWMATMQLRMHMASAVLGVALNSRLKAIKAWNIPRTICTDDSGDADSTASFQLSTGPPLALLRCTFSACRAQICPN